MNKTEYRTFGLDEARTTEGGNTLVGHAAVFNVLADIGGMFSEQISPGAFAKTLADHDDVRALFNHDENNILGRTPDTLRLSEDDKGLAVEIDMPDTTLGRDLMVSVKRKDISNMSFAFIVTRESWNEVDPKNLIRTIQEAKLYDVSPVTFPAYSQTDLSARSAESILNDYRATQGLRPGAQPEPITEPMTPTSVLREQLRIADELGK